MNESSLLRSFNLFTGDDSVVVPLVLVALRFINRAVVGHGAGYYGVLLYRSEQGKSNIRDYTGVMPRH